MPDTFTDLHDTGIALGELQLAIRQDEELGLDLIELGCSINGGVEMNFSNYREVEDAAPLPVRLEPMLASQNADAARDFIATRGGEFLCAGALKIQGQPLVVAAYRGTLTQPAPAPAPEPEPAPVPVPAPVQPVVELPIPRHAWPFFTSERVGEWGGVPWERMEEIAFQLDGLTGSRVFLFKNETGQPAAILLVTDADVDTDGPGGSKAVDPDWQSGTSLNFPGPVACDSRRFPGVVRSARLLRSFGLNIGDFGFAAFAGNVHEFQVYDQGDDSKIGEISIFLARQLGTVPPDRDDHWAATRGNNTRELVTLFFPQTTPGRALDNAAIQQRARECWRRFTGRDRDVTAPAVQPPGQLLGGAAQARPGAGAEPRIFSTEEWSARAARASFTSRPARGIVLHNTEDANRAPEADGSAEIRRAFALARKIQGFHMDARGWSDTGQHFTVSRGGVITEGRHGSLAAARRGEVVRGAHAGDTTCNNEWFGIEIEGDFRGELAIAPPQLDAVLTLCAWLRARGGFGADKLIGHGQINPGHTDCPGLLTDQLDKIRAEVTRRMA